MKYLDLTTTNRDGSIEGLYVKKYRDGETLVKIFFEGLSHSEIPVQDYVDAWLSQEQVGQLIETLQED